MLTWLRHERRWTLALTDATDLTRPLRFDGSDPRAFGLPGAAANAVAGDGWVLRTTRGGAVNCDTVSVTPHGNTTHTETAGHIAAEQASIGEHPLAPMLGGVVLRVAPAPLVGSGEGYSGKTAPGDRVVTAAGLEAAWRSLHEAARACFREVAVVATGVGGSLEAKPAEAPTYLTSEAVAWLLAVGFDHLVLDVPSIDRTDDGGGLANHHAFWGLPPRGPSGAPRSLDRATGVQRTITELALVPDTLAAGPGALLLAPARWHLDAAPSRVVFIPARLLG